MTTVKNQWKQDEIRILRLRLGWTQSDLARRLECEAKMVESLEAGSIDVAVEIVHKLEMISHQADLCGEEVQSTPAAENFCDQEHLGQVELNKVRRSL